jgi:hypothetical protein
VLAELTGFTSVIRLGSGGEVEVGKRPVEDTAAWMTQTLMPEIDAWSGGSKGLRL